MSSPRPPSLDSAVGLNSPPQLRSSMLRPWLRRGTLRALSLPARTVPPLLNVRFSSTPAAQTPDRVPLRKQLKQQAKSLRSHKRQRKEDEEASRQEWELTVGVEIHAQLDTEAKLFSRTSLSVYRSEASLTWNRSSNLHQRCSQFQRCPF